MHIEDDWRGNANEAAETRSVIQHLRRCLGRDGRSKPKEKRVVSKDVIAGTAIVGTPAGATKAVTTLPEISRGAHSGGRAPSDREVLPRRCVWQFGL